MSELEFSNQDRLKLGSDLDHLTTSYEREGFDPPAGIHFELVIIPGWLLYNGLPVNILLEGVETFVRLIEEKRQAEQADTLQ